MAKPNLKTVLYTVKAESIPIVMEQSLTSEPDSQADLYTDRDVELLVAALRMGRRVQAMTALPDGTVLFALDIG